MSTSSTKKKRKKGTTHTSLQYTIHHCQLIISYWCRNLQLDIVKISYINSTICQTIISYRGPGDIVAFSTNGTLSSIEIYNNNNTSKEEEDDTKDEKNEEQYDNYNYDDTFQDLTDKLCIKRVHSNMKFNYNDSNYTQNEVIRSWHPTLCPTLDYHYVYRIGGGDPLKGLFGESSNNVDIFDLYTMTNIKLPNMKYRRAKCSATMLPPTIPFHDYQDIDEQEDCQPPDLNKLFIQQFKNPRIPKPPPPPVLDMQSMDDILNELAEDDDDDDEEDDDPENDSKDNKNEVNNNNESNGIKLAKTNEDTNDNKTYKISTTPTTDTNGGTTAPLAPMAPKKTITTNQYIPF